MLRHYSHASIAISHGKFAGEMEGVALRNIKMDSRCIHAILLRPLPLTDDSWTPCTRYRCGRSIQHIVHKDLIFFHVSLTNNSNVPFDVDFVRFKIVDKKIAKRTAQQETYIEPVRTLNALTRIEGKSTGRIVYAFPKIVIPDDKLLEVEIYEKGGGRHQRFYIENSDLVDARIVNELIGE